MYCKIHPLEWSKGPRIRPGSPVFSPFLFFDVATRRSHVTGQPSKEGFFDPVFEGPSASSSLRTNCYPSVSYSLRCQPRFCFDLVSVLTLVPRDTDYRHYSGFDFAFSIVPDLFHAILPFIARPVTTRLWLPFSPSRVRNSSSFAAVLHIPPRDFGNWLIRRFNQGTSILRLYSTLSFSKHVYLVSHRSPVAG